MSGINFKGVEEAKETQMTRPGTIEVFDIKEVKFDTSKNKGTMYLSVQFVGNGHSFTHSFFLTEKALPRIKSLIKIATGVSADDELSEAQIIKMLENKKMALKVTAKFDDANGRAYPDLPFGGFAKAPEAISELFFSDKEAADIKRADEIRANASTAGADRPEPMSSSGAAKADDEPVF